MKKPVSFALAIVASLLLSACGGTSGGQSSPQPGAVQAQKQQVVVPTASAVCKSLVEMLNPTKLCPRPQEKDGVIFSQDADVRLQILPDGKIMLVNVRATQARTKNQLISITREDQATASAFAAALAALVAAQGAKQLASTANYAVEALQQNAVELRVDIPSTVSKQRTAGGNGKPQVVTKLTLKCVNGGQFRLTLSDNNRNTVDETGKRAGCWKAQAEEFLKEIKHKLPRSAWDLFDQIVQEIQAL